MTWSVIWELTQLQVSSPAGSALRLCAGAGMLGAIAAMLWVLIRGVRMRDSDPFGGLLLALIIPFGAVTVGSNHGELSEPTATYALMLAIGVAVSVFRLTRPLDPAQDPTDRDGDDAD